MFSRDHYWQVSSHFFNFKIHVVLSMVSWKAFVTCWSKCIAELKIICNEEPSMSLQNVKKTGKECSFLRRYSVATCSFTKNKTPSQVFTVCNEVSGSLWWNTLVVICLQLLSTIFVVITFYKWRRERISDGPYKMVSLFTLNFLIGYGSTRCTICSQLNGML